MPSEPTVKKAILFVDGQNLFYAAKEAFGYTYPNYDPKKLAERICEQKGWTLAEVRLAHEGAYDVCVVVSQTRI